MSKQPLSVYESAGEIELGRGEVISTTDLSAHPGNYPVYSSSAVGEGIFGKYGRHMFDEELITWSIDGGGKPFYRKKHKYSVTNVCGFLRIHRRDLWNYRYLHAILERLQSGIQFDYQMKAHPSVIRELYKLERIPLAEQNAIADVLDTLDTAIHQTEAIVEKLKQVKQGLLHDLLTRGVDANGELRPSYEEAPHLYQDSPLGWIPKEWECRQLEKLAKYVNGKTFDAGAWSDIGIPIIRIQNLNGSPEFNYYTGKVNEAWHIYPGDLLFAWAGQRGVSFGARLWQGPEGVLNQHIFKVTPNPEIISKTYLFHLLRFRQTAIEDSAHGFKDSFLHVTRGELGEIFAAIPSLREQSLIEERIFAYEKKLLNEEIRLKKLQRMKSALMNDLLTGRVRVTPLLQGTSQTPKFEP